MLPAEQKLSANHDEYMSYCVHGLEHGYAIKHGKHFAHAAVLQRNPK